MKATHDLSPADTQVLGLPKAGTTHFAVTQEVRPKRWQSIRTWVDTPGVLQSVFPIALCSVAFVRDRWGPGIYKCSWLLTDTQGKSTVLGPGRRFEVAKPAAPEPVADPTGVQNRERREKRPLRVKVKRGSLKSQLAVLGQLQAMTRASVDAAVSERVAFIQAEAQRNREHQLEIEKLRLRADRDRRQAEPAESSSNDDVTSAVASGIAQIVEKLDAVVEGGGSKSDVMRIGEMLAPGFNKIVGIVEKVVLDKLALDDGDEEPEEGEEPDEGEEATQ